MYFFFQAEDGIRELVRSRGLGDVYEGQVVQRQPAGWLLVSVGELSQPQCTGLM